tara:strand:- start:2773 stop:3222 length:450 start_codon:yes stop_codon:yes gene_type:complete
MTNFKCNVYPHKYECQEGAVGDFGTKNDCDLHCKSEFTKIKKELSEDIEQCIKDKIKERYPLMNTLIIAPIAVIGAKKVLTALENEISTNNNQGSSNSKSNNSSNSDKNLILGLSLPAFIGIIIGSVFFIILIIILINKRRKTRKISFI